jgi:hypothetical protein
MVTLPAAKINGSTAGCQRLAHQLAHQLAAGIADHIWSVRELLEAA